MSILSNIPLPLIANPALLARIRKAEFSGWHNRALYINDSGHDLWISVINDSRYLESSAARNAICNAFTTAPRSQFLSLGPGDGGLDRDILSESHGGVRQVQYIPVDINMRFLLDAAIAVRPYASVPFGILADFEEHGDFVVDSLQNAQDSPRVIGLLGNTFANLDRGEATFMGQWRSLMKQGDILVIDAAATIHNSTTKTAHSQLDSIRRLFSNGVTRQTGCDVDQVINSYSDRTSLGEWTSDVPGSAAFSIIYDLPQRGPVTVLKSCNYHWQSLSEWFWIRWRMRTVFQHVIETPGTAVGRGVLAVECC